MDEGAAAARNLITYVRRLRNPEEQSRTVATLLGALEAAGSERPMAAAAERIAAAGAIPLLLEIVGASQDSHLLSDSAALLMALAQSSRRHAEAIAAAGGAEPLVRLMRSACFSEQYNATDALLYVAASSQRAAGRRRQRGPSPLCCRSCGTAGTAACCRPPASLRPSLLAATCSAQRQCGRPQVAWPASSSSCAATTLPFRRLPLTRS